jgi:hypothetical protein
MTQFVAVHIWYNDPAFKPRVVIIAQRDLEYIAVPIMAFVSLVFGKYVRSRRQLKERLVSNVTLPQNSVGSSPEMRPRKQLSNLETYISTSCGLFGQLRTAVY